MNFTEFITLEVFRSFPVFTTFVTAFVQATKRFLPEVIPAWVYNIVLSFALMTSLTIFVDKTPNFESVFMGFINSCIVAYIGATSATAFNFKTKTEQKEIRKTTVKKGDAPK